MTASRQTGDPPFISECEVLHEGGPSFTDLFHECSKNPGHPTFIPVKEFTMEHLPTSYRSQRVMETIRCCSERTVKVTVRYTSWDRPATFPNSNSPYPFTRFKGSTRAVRVGTGIIAVFNMKVVRGRDCPCVICKHSDKPAREYKEFVVQTATHVVFDDSEAEKSTFELFYDSEEDRDNVKCLYGVRTYGHIDSIKDLERIDTDCRKEEGDVERRCYRDRINILCVSHETELELSSNSYSIAHPLSLQLQPHWKALEHDSDLCIDKNIAIIISHPHGKSKHITLGKIMYFNHPRPYSLDESYVEECCADFFRRFLGLGVKSYPNNNHLDQTKHDKTVTRCTIRRGTLLRFSSASSSIFPTDDYQKFMTSCKHLNGPQFSRLSEDIDLLIPTESSYLCRRNLGLIKWLSFPVGTRFQSSHFGKNVFLLPDKVVFFFPLPGCYRKTRSVEIFETYNTNTCPGSSGAPIIREFGMGSTREFITYSGALHSGALSDGTNRCSVTTYTNLEDIY